MANAPHATRLLLPGKVRILTAVLHRTESIGFEVTHGYGLTETAVLVVRCTWKREWNKLPTLERARLKARQGVRMPGMAEVDIVNGETGCSVPRKHQARAARAAEQGGAERRAHEEEWRAAVVALGEECLALMGRWRELKDAWRAHGEERKEQRHQLVAALLAKRDDGILPEH